MIAGRMDIKYLIASCSVFIFGNLVRTFRFRQLDHTDKKLTHWWNINAFYNFITATLPGGAGEAATAYVLKRFSEFNILNAFRILILIRLMDAFALSVLFFLASVRISSVAPYREAATWLSGALFLMTSIALIPASEHFVLTLLQRLPGNITFIQKVCQKLNELLETAKNRRGFSSHAYTLVQSALVIIAGIAAMHLILRSFGIDFTPEQSVYCYGVYLIFQIVPVQGIAGIGTQAAWWALALKAAGYQGNDAIALGFVLHGTFYLFIASMGILSVLIWLKRRKKKSVF